MKRSILSEFLNNIKLDHSLTFIMGEEKTL